LDPSALLAFTFDQGTWTLTVTGPLPGDALCGANAISDNNLLVGVSAQADGLFQRASIWKDGQVFDLNDFIATELPVNLVRGIDINAFGQILALGWLNGATVAFQLDPIDPSPADLDGDCDADLFDLVRLLNAWGGHESIADFNVDGVVDALDYLFLLAHWSARPSEGGIS
jgi:hypothetical protein